MHSPALTKACPEVNSESNGTKHWQVPISCKEAEVISDRLTVAGSNWFTKNPRCPVLLNCFSLVSAWKGSGAKLRALAVCFETRRN